MSCLPRNGRLDCDLCHGGEGIEFNVTRTASDDGKWRITANPLAWGSQTPKVLVLGFSKGVNALEALAEGRRHQDIPYAGKRTWIARLLHGAGLLGGDQAEHADREIADTAGDFHFGSLVRCTVEQRQVDAEGNEKWITTNNGMLEGFTGHPFGRSVLDACLKRFVVDLPRTVELVVLFGYGRNLGGARKGKPDLFSYVENVRAAMGRAFGSPMTSFNETCYYNDRVTVLHLEHFSEPANASNWLDDDHDRSRLRRKAVEAVAFARSRREGLKTGRD